MDAKTKRRWKEKVENGKQAIHFQSTEELKTLLHMYENKVVGMQNSFQKRYLSLDALEVAEENKRHQPSTFEIAHRHSSKNRTLENYPTDEATIQFQDENPNFYINASLIETDTRVYIATQHPLDSTISDFWKMVLHQKPTVIVMLNKHEFDKQAFGLWADTPMPQYWPDSTEDGIGTLLLKDEASGTFIKVSTVDIHYNSQRTSPPSTSTDTTNTVNVSTMNGTQAEKTKTNSRDEKPLVQEAKLTEKVDHNPIQVTKLRVEHGDSQHEVWHVMCSDWLDQTEPDLQLFLQLWQVIEEKLRVAPTQPDGKHRIIVHCISGVGRTGTFIAVDIVGQQFMENLDATDCKPFSIDAIIKFMRSRRKNMVAKDEQYIFAHKAALEISKLIQQQQH